MRIYKAVGIALLVCAGLFSLIGMLSSSTTVQAVKGSETMTVHDTYSHHNTLIPLIDAATPDRIETATFALG